jgi:hypothetical protein
MSFSTTGEHHPSEDRASAQMSPDRIIADMREDRQLYVPRESWVSCQSHWQLFRRSWAANFSRRVHPRSCWECIARVHCEAVAELAVLEPMNTTTKDLHRVGCPDETNWTELAVLDTTTRDLQRVGCPDVKNWTELANAY